MNIKEITDKIVKEADINPSEYSVADRITDVNTEYFMLIEKATQIGSTEPIANSEVKTESFTLVEGDNTFTRTITDIPVVGVEFTSDTTVTSDSYFGSIVYNQPFYLNECGSEVSIDEKTIIVHKGKVGTLKISYAHGEIVPFTEADYNSITPPSPTWLPITFHPLLWLKPALIQATYYKKDRQESLKFQYDELYTLFTKHYSRNSARNGQIISKVRNYR